MDRDPVITREDANKLNVEQLSRVGRLAVNICCFGPFDLTDSPISFMENIKNAVRDISKEI